MSTNDVVFSDRQNWLQAVDYIVSTYLGYEAERMVSRILGCFAAQLEFDRFFIVIFSCSAKDTMFNGLLPDSYYYVITVRVKSA